MLVDDSAFEFVYEIGDFSKVRISYLSILLFSYFLVLFFLISFNDEEDYYFYYSGYNFDFSYSLFYF